MKNIKDWEEVCYYLKITIYYIQLFLLTLNYIAVYPFQFSSFHVLLGQLQHSFPGRKTKRADISSATTAAAVTLGHHHIIT
jgi:hypothetical protein